MAERISGPALEAVGLSFGYRSDDPIFEDWSARFEGGAATAVTGPSGCGKSTLLFLLGLLVDPWQGEIALNGLPLNSRSDRFRAAQRASHFGFVFQDAALDPTRTVIDNVIEPAVYALRSRTDAASRAIELLERFGLGHRARHRPGEISGGQAQRIGLCRAILNDPTVLLADEPTGNLDAESSDVVLEVLLETAGQGSAVVIVTHNADVARRCDSMIELPRC